MVLNVQKPEDTEGAIIEAWAEGYMVGSLIIMACVAFSNMRRGVLLHKLIVVEVRGYLPKTTQLVMKLWALTRDSLCLEHFMARSSSQMHLCTTGT